jgi:hypothetical protein
MRLSDQDTERYICKKLDRLPPRLRRLIQKLRNARPIWLKLIAAALLIVGGLLWFLPLVGIWMLPLGLLILVDEFPVAKRLLVRVLVRIEGWAARKKKVRSDPL